MSYTKYLLVVLICFLFSVESFAKDSNNTVLDSLFSSSVCKKSAKPLAGGNKHGSLKKNRSVVLYAGPSGGCSKAGNLSPKTPFIAIGKAKSLFGRTWYKVQVNGKSQKRWLAAKHVVLGDIVKVDFEEEEINSTTLTASINLNARSCPDTSCGIVGNLGKDKEYIATKQAENGWYFVTFSNGKTGWASGKFLEEKFSNTAKKSTLKNGKRSDQKRAQMQPSLDRETSSYDPCKISFKHKQYDSKYIWRVIKPVTFLEAPHDQCGKTFVLEKGRAFIPYGETGDYYIIATVADFGMGVGYLRKEDFKKHYIRMKSLSKEVNVLDTEMVNLLNEYEKEWNTLSFQIKYKWKLFENWVDRNTEEALILFALLLGSLALLTKWTRKKMLRLDQICIRTLYFFIRSRQFWQMMRKLLFILVTAGIAASAVFFYVMWLKEVANDRQMYMGIGSLVMMSMSVGIFGVRVASFFSGLVLFFMSIFEFLLFVLFLYMLFLLPSLLLLLFYYSRYRKERNDGNHAQKVFDHNEVERIHERVFQLKNFYPETVINWARKGSFKGHWQSFKDIIFAKSDVFDDFFTRVNNAHRL